MGSEQGRHIRSIGVAMVTWGLLGLLLSIRAIAQEGSEKLPQGNSGIAVKYPGDEGIERDPAVVFTENFEHARIEAVGKRWSEVSKAITLM